MNAQVQTMKHTNVAPDVVCWWKVSERSVKNRKQPAKGYALMNGPRMLALIETTKPLPRIEELLDVYSDPERLRTARELMRTLLNAEDYRSEIYDVIVRIHYTEDFA